MKQKLQIMILGLLLVVGSIIFTKPSWLMPYLPSMVAKALAGGDGYRPPDPNGWNGLHAAASMKNLAMAKQYLEFGEDVNMISTYEAHGTTPLVEAAFSGNADIVKLYLDHGAKVNILNKVGESALFYASNAKVARLLIEAGDDPNRLAEWGTPLHSAARWERPEVIKVLLEKGAKVNIYGKSGESPLHYASTAEVARLLIAAGADPKRSSKSGTPMHSAAGSGRIEVAKVLLKHGADVNAHRNKNEGFKPLLRAITNGRTEFVQFLVDNGSDLEVSGQPVEPLPSPVDRSKYFSTSLHSAAYFNQPEIAKILVKAGIKINSRDFQKKTPLHRAAFNQAFEAAKWLVDHGADVHTKDEGGNTPLHIAAKNQMDYIKQQDKQPMEIIKLLLDKGAKLDVKNKWDRTPLDLAREGKYQKIVDFLQKYANSH